MEHLGKLVVPFDAEHAQKCPHAFFNQLGVQANLLRVLKHVYGFCKDESESGPATDGPLSGCCSQSFCWHLSAILLQVGHGFLSVPNTVL